MLQLYSFKRRKYGGRIKNLPCQTSCFADYALGHPAKVGFRNLGLGFRVFLGLGLALGLGLVLYLGLGLVLG